MGGNAGPRPRLGELLVEDVASQDQVLEIVARIVDFYKSASEEGRLGRLVEKMGIEAFRAAVLGEQPVSCAGSRQ